jgi:hypothetical protein
VTDNPSFDNASAPPTPVAPWSNEIVPGTIAAD